MIKRIAFIGWFVAMALFGLSTPFAHADVQSSSFQQGANLMPMTNAQLDSAPTKQVYLAMKANGMTTAVLNPIYQQDNIHSTEIWRRSDSPTDEQLARAIKNAHDAGLKVVLKPHLELKNSEWRAHIAFDNNKDADAWQKNWNKILVHLATMKGVDSVVIGTEMRGVVTKSVPSKNLTFNKKNPDRWIKTVKLLRKEAPKVKLTYAAHTNDESEYLSKSFVKKLDYLSLTYYPRPPAGNKNPSVAELKADMQKDVAKYFKPLRKRYNKNIVLAETGFRSVKLESYYKKADEVGPNDVDVKIQAAQYEAFFQFIDGISYIKGVWLYRYYNTPGAGGYKDPWFTPQNKPAEEVIARWFGGTVS